MKLVKIFSLFLVLHIVAWSGAHWYLSQNKPEVLLVVDTSYSMKPKFSEMRDWIASFESSSRYKTVIVGTDKALLGNLAELKSHSVIFRTAFGRMTETNLQRYSSSKNKEKILLSDGSLTPDGWKLVIF